MKVVETSLTDEGGAGGGGGAGMTKWTKFFKREVRVFDTLRHWRMNLKEVEY